LEYKTKQETERLTETAAAVRQREQSLSALEEKEKKKKKQLEAAEAKLTVAKQDSLTFSDIDGMSGNRTMLGGKIILSADDWEKVSAFAKSGVKFHSAIVDLKKKNSGLSQKNADLEKRLESYEGRNIDGRMKYHQAAQRAPRRLAETVADILRKPPETAEPDDLTRQRNVTNREVR
jgi:multidrug resistance efflux pump